MKYLITGGTGFLGKWLVKKLVEENPSHTIVIMARSPAKSPGNGGDDELLAMGATFVQGTVMDYNRLIELCKEGQYDGIFHLAGKVEHSRRDPREMFSLHIEGTLNVLKAALETGVKRVVYASTSGVVGCAHSFGEVANDDSPYCSKVVEGQPYYVSKIKAEQAALEFVQQHDNKPELIIMRPTLILGPGDTRLSSVTVVHEFLRKNIPVIPPGGLSVVDVRDTADAFVAGMNRGIPPHTYLLGSANLTHEEFLNSLSTVSGVKSPAIRFPISIILFFVKILYFFTWKLFRIWIKEKDPAFVEMGTLFWSIDSGRAQKELGFNPRGYLQTLRETIIWLRSVNKY